MNRITTSAPIIYTTHIRIYSSVFTDWTPPFNRRGSEGSLRSAPERVFVAGARQAVEGFASCPFLFQRHIYVSLTFRKNKTLFIDHRGSSRRAGEFQNRPRHLTLSISRRPEDSWLFWECASLLDQMFRWTTRSKPSKTHSLLMFFVACLIKPFTNCSHIC